MKKKVYLFLISIVFLTFSESVFAAEMFLVNSDESSDGRIIVELRVDPQGENINAVSGEIKYDSDFLFFDKFDQSGSFISLWPESPKEEDGAIYFSGITPGGFKGLQNVGVDNLGSGKVLSIIFRPKSTGQTRINLINTTLIRHDGEATRIPSNDDSLFLSVNDDIDLEEVISKDNIKPEEFEPILTRSDFVHDGAWILVFNTVDKGSGIDHFEVKEGDGEFIRSENPYLLKDQSRSSIILVRAIDRSGNERTVKINPSNFSLGGVSLKSIFIALFSIFVLAFVIFTWKKRKKRRSS